MKNLSILLAVFIFSTEVVLGRYGSYSYKSKEGRECSHKIDIDHGCKEGGTVDGFPCFKPKTKDINVLAGWKQEAKMVLCRQSDVNAVVQFTVSKGPISFGIGGTSNYLTCKHGDWYAKDYKGNNVKVEDARCEIIPTPAPGSSP
ncbi:unnamed protein product [Caenorhabditis auriculariae]|uniref:C6 domain-containing protein n=1 Tax=Caenorhabditis auriculariae TaxID=2777116 RepID=A0A8S1H2B6_9PELO|nr:unnamed protein product [Caenorhabditis auriculariae]